MPMSINGTSNSHASNTKPRRSSLTHHSPSLSPTPSNSGTSTLSTLWRTRRHTGSARALAFSTDGSTLFSAGTDGLLKAADVLTGRVVGKVAVPPGDSEERSGRKRGGGRGGSAPNALLALNPTNLVLGDDSGGVCVYSLSRTSRAISIRGTEEKFTALTPSASSTQRLHPHRTEDDPYASEPVTSLTALPPSVSSSSGVRRAWVSTAGGTVAVVDLHKGVVSTSVEQGGKMGEELLSGVYCVPDYSSLGSTSSTNAKAKTNGKGSSDVSANATVLIGDSSGILGVWPRTGKFKDRAAAVRVHKALPSVGLWDDDAGVECLAVQHPPSPSSTHITEMKDPLIAAGLGNGLVRFLRLLPSSSSSSASTSKSKPGQDANVNAKLLDAKIHHDERGLDGVSVIAFDVEGRLLTGGGTVVKVWHPAAGRVIAGTGAAKDDDEAESDSDEDEGKGDSDAEAGEHASEHGNGIAAIDGMADTSIEADEDEDSDDNAHDSSSSSEEETKHKRKKRRRERSSAKAKRMKNGGSHGILAFKGL